MSLLFSLNKESPWLERQPSLLIFYLSMLSSQVYYKICFYFAFVFTLTNCITPHIEMTKQQADSFGPQHLVIPMLLVGGFVYGHCQK